jgi:hypothetical protein
VGGEIRHDAIDQFVGTLGVGGSAHTARLAYLQHSFQQ